MMALYAFARLVDDWGDLEGGSSRAAQAMQWHTWIDVCSEKSKDGYHPSSLNPAPPVSACTSIQLALSDTINRFEIPIQYLHEVIDGVTLDVASPILIENREQLEKYCYLVASSVGLACLSIWGGNKPAVYQSAIDCGWAFQLTNILRDVQEDRNHGRIYLPLDLLAAHHVDHVAWLAGEPSGDLHAVLRTVVEWARTAYRSGWHVHSSLDSDGQRMFSLMWHTYHRLLERIASDPEAALARRVCLSPFEKTSLYLQHAITPWYHHLSSRYDVDA